MLELGRKEHQVSSGIFVQILLVGLLVFAYTQAVRQVNHSREMFTRLQEQLTVARDQMARRAPASDTSALQAEVDKLKWNFADPAALDFQLRRIEQAAREGFALKDIQVQKTESPVDTLSFPIEGRPDLEVQLYGLELTAQATTRSAAGLAATLAEPNSQPILSLATLELRAAELGVDLPVRMTARWLVPVLEGNSRPEVVPAAPPPVRLEWGNREEPFFSPLAHPGALRVSPDKTASLHLTGILWDPAKPSCVINRRVFKLGEWVESYQVVLIMPKAVVLQGLDDEVLLQLS